MSLSSPSQSESKSELKNSSARSTSSPLLSLFIQTISQASISLYTTFPPLIQGILPFLFYLAGIWQETAVEKMKCKYEA